MDEKDSRIERIINLLDNQIPKLLTKGNPIEDSMLEELTEDCSYTLKSIPDYKSHTPCDYLFFNKKDLNNLIKTALNSEEKVVKVVDGKYVVINTIWEDACWSTDCENSYIKKTKIELSLEIKKEQIYFSIKSLSEKLGEEKQIMYKNLEEQTKEYKTPNNQNEECSGSNSDDGFEEWRQAIY